MRPGDGAAIVFGGGLLAVCAVGACGHLTLDGGPAMPTRRAGTVECRIVAPAYDVAPVSRVLIGADYRAGRWSRDGRTVGYSVTEDSTVWNMARCGR